MRKRQAPRVRARAADPAGYWTGAHTKHRLRVHLVWVPKYRRRVLEGTVAARLDALLRQACEVNRWGLHELSVQPDHVHLLVQLPPTDCVSDVLGSLKGGTSRALRSEFADLEEYLWGDSFWGDGYFAETVGQAEEAVVRAYIQKWCGPTSRTRACPSVRPSREQCPSEPGIRPRRGDGNIREHSVYRHC